MPSAGRSVSPCFQYSVQSLGRDRFRFISPYTTARLDKRQKIFFHTDIVLHSANTSEIQATKKPHNYHKIAVWQKDDRIRKSPLKFCVSYYSELKGDYQASIITELWRLSVVFCVTLWHMRVSSFSPPNARKVSSGRARRIQMSSLLFPKSCAPIGSVHFKDMAFPKSTTGLICGTPFPLAIRVNKASIEQKYLLGLIFKARNASRYGKITGSSLTFLPYKVPKEPRKKIGWIRYITFAASLIFVAALFLAHVGSLERIMFWAFIIGNILYYTTMNVDVTDNSRKRKNGTECILCMECVKNCPKDAL